MPQPVNSLDSEDPAVLPSEESFASGDLDLDVVLQKVVVDSTGLPGSSVLPRWQPIEPTYPEYGTNWCSVGVTSEDPDQNTAVTVNNQEQIVSHRHETITVLLSFYGPQASALCGRFRDGLYIGQNRQALDLNGLRVYRLGVVRRVPSLLNQRWQNRVDFEVLFRRHTTRTYPISTVIQSDGVITDGNTSFSFDTGVIE